MTSKRFSVLSEDERNDMLASAADPRYRNMPGPPCGKTPDENLGMLLAMIRFAVAIGKADTHERPLPPKNVLLLL